MDIYEEKTVVNKIHYKTPEIKLYVYNEIHSIYNDYFIVSYDNGEDIQFFHVDCGFELNIGTKVFLKNHKYHNESGAAMISKDGDKAYYLNGIHYPDITSDEEWLIKQIIE